jgi:hypothetical protein
MAIKNKDVYIDLAEKMTDYYDKKIINTKKKVDALSHYKHSGYAIINQILLGKCEYQFSLDNILSQFRKEDKVTMKEVLTYVSQEYYNELETSMEAIKTLDKIIAEAPTILNKEILVYRGMTADIYDDLICENKKYYYTFPTYVSTSFSSHVSQHFRGRNGVFYTLILPPDTKGIYLPWDIKYKESFGKATIDNEFEYLLLRGSKFLVESIEYKQEPSYKGFSIYQNIPCEKEHPRYVRHYTMRLVSQPSIKQLQKQYKTMLSNAKVDFIPWEFENVKGKTIVDKAT